jgi:hypothetical protein
MKFNQRGFAAVETILILVIIAIISGTGYYVFHTKNNTDNIADSSTLSRPVKSIPSSVLIKEWGVRLKTPYADKVTYDLGSDSEVQSADLRFKKDVVDPDKCDIGLGVFRTKDPAKVDSVTPPTADKAINGYYYWITGGPAPCHTGTSIDRIQLDILHGVKIIKE